MDIKVLNDMVIEALSALDEYHKTRRTDNNIFNKIRAVGDICIDNNDLHPFLKENLDIRKQYAFKNAAFFLRQITSLGGGQNDNETIKKNLNTMKLAYDELLNQNIHHEQNLRKNIMNKSTKVFIVHGHDKQAKIEVARFIENAGLEAIILHEQPSAGQTIIEKIESFGNVGFAVILYTPCDVGAKKTEQATLLDRARQNVVFEHGYFIGRLGRQKVTALVKGNVETPNDISGVVYTELDSNGAWKMTLFNELKNAGYNISDKAIR